MPISHIVDFCNRQYYRDERCIDCPNEECHNSCLACLEDIHNINRHERTYNCNNIAYCYTCKYIYRYSSEIEYLLKHYISIFRNTQFLNVCSIGCGPCSELFGLDSFKRKNQLNFQINYKGFELTDIWKNIHQKINLIFDYNIEFIYDNVFTHYETEEKLPNVVILNYVLSDILRNKNNFFDAFLNNICVLFQRLPNAALIINDINLGRNSSEIRSYYEPLITRLKSENNIAHIGKFHFENSQKNYYSFGEKHQNNIAIMKPPQDIIDTYSPWLECRSAQCVILKRGEQL